MKKSLILSFIAAALCGLGLVAPQSVSALDADSDSSIFAEEDDDNSAALRFGRNLLFAGNNLDIDTRSNGLLFSFGNQLGLQSESEYAFVAGNVIDFAGKTKADLFVAGSSVTIADDAEIGRDVFATGNIIKISADLPGNLAIAGNKVILKDIEIDGDVNLDVASLEIEGEVAIAGKLAINSDADIIGLSHVSYDEIERYAIVAEGVDATTVLIAKLLSISGLFVTMVIIIALFPRVGRKVAREMTALQFGKDLLIGLGVLVFVPFISVFLVISIFGVPAGLILLAAYIIMIYLAQGFTSLWLGKLLIEKLMHLKGNNFLEVLLGIILLGFGVMIPGVGWTLGLVSLIFGLGLMMQCVRSGRSHKTQDSHEETENQEIEEAELVESTKTPEPKNTSKSKKSSTSTKATQKSSDLEDDMED